MMTRCIFQHTLLLLSTMLVIAFSSCHGSYPVQLTQADSLILHGKYQEADSLLADYDCHASNSKHDRMYRQLLHLERKFVNSELTTEDFSITDSLCRYYDNRYTQNEYAKALCLLCEVYKVNKDYPSSLGICLKALQIAEKEKLTYVTGWLYQKTGDLYFLQRMLPECTNYYRRYYNIAVNNHDTLRMALAADRMGKVSTINNKVDSTIYYYEKAIELAQHTAHPENIIPVCKYSLSDIYIQIEEYEKAKELMQHDSLNDANWAYWHLGQNHTDSAFVYFSRLIENKSWSTRVEYLSILAKLEEERGNHHHALSLFKDLTIAKDSLLAHSQVEEMRKVKQQHDFNIIKQERDTAQEQSTMRGYIIGIICIFIIMVSAIAYLSRKKFLIQKERQLSQERLLRQETERRNRQSAAQIERNKEQISFLNQQLQEARDNNNAVEAEKLQLETRLLHAENEQIQVKLQHEKVMKTELELSPLKERIKLNAGKERFHLTDDEWQQLATLIDNANDQFTIRLRNLYDNITEYDLHICYLVKLDIPSVAIGTMLYKSKAAIGMARQRLYLKLTGEKGTAKDFNNFIQAF